MKEDNKLISKKGKVINETSSAFFQGISKTLSLSDFPTSDSLFPSVLKQEINETISQEKSQVPVFVDIHGPEIAELQEKIEKLEQKEEQQIIPIQFLESDRIILKQPIFVNLSYYPENKLYIIDCPELDIYGEGRDEHKAIEDFKIVLEEFYFNLKKDKEKLGSDLANKWRILENVCKEK